MMAELAYNDCVPVLDCPPAFEFLRKSIEYWRKLNVAGVCVRDKRHFLILGLCCLIMPVRVGDR